MQSFICALTLSLLPFGRPSAFYSNLINLLIYPVIILISGRAKTFVRPSSVPTVRPSVCLFVCFCIRHLSYQCFDVARLEHFRQQFCVLQTVYQLHRQPVGQANSNCPAHALTLTLPVNPSTWRRSV